jgi:hypothetical protein
MGLRLCYELRPPADLAEADVADRSTDRVP